VVGLRRPIALFERRCQAFRTIGHSAIEIRWMSAELISSDELPPILLCEIPIPAIDAFSSL
jgi:hypothetical protein